MNLNTKELFDEALNEFLPDFKKKAKEFFNNFFNKKIGVYFCDAQEIQRMKDNPSIARMRGIDLNDPDTGLAVKMINDFLTDHILSENFEKHMKHYMETNFPKILNEAMDKAMQHKANTMAFQAVKEKDHAS